MLSSLAFAFITLPWLNPFADGPSPSVPPLLLRVRLPDACVMSKVLPVCVWSTQIARLEDWVPVPV